MRLPPSASLHCDPISLDSDGVDWGVCDAVVQVVAVVEMIQGVVLAEVYEKTCS
jgi:hypothetical protein